MVRVLDLADGHSSATAPDVAGQIAQVSMAIANNTTANITGLLLSNADKLQALLVYYVNRETDVVTRKNQSGTYNAFFDGTDWQISEIHIDGDDAGLELGITSGGQVTYTTSLLAGATHTGQLEIRAETLES